jgi:hypothetical protein
LSFDILATVLATVLVTVLATVLATVLDSFGYSFGHSSKYWANFVSIFWFWPQFQILGQFCFYLLVTLPWRQPLPLPQKNEEESFLLLF